MQERDLLIIGGGPAGYVAAIRAAQLGAKATLIEENALGGTCLNRGCIPMRALVRGVEFIDLVKKARDYGFNYGEASVDLAKMMARKDTVVKTVVGGVGLLLKENGVQIVQGRARLLSPSEVEVQQQGGDSPKITARRIIIATGSRLKRLSIPGADGDGVITTDQALELKEVPRSMLIVGGGAIAFAFATIFSKLGTSVIVIEGSTQILPGVDREIVSLFERELKKDRIPVYTQVYIKAIADEGREDKAVAISIGGEETTLTSQCVLIAEEREANIDGLGLDRVGVKVSDGGITVNSGMETSVPGIFAAGDVTGGQMLAHVAFAQGRVAVENALGKQSEIDYTAVPRCINATPEIASVGLTEDEVLAQGYQIRIGRFPFAASGMATILGERTGMIKIISEAKYGQILGVHIIGPQASNLIPEAVLAMKLDATPQEISSAIHTHPTLSEALMEAAMAVTGESIHSLPSG